MLLFTYWGASCHRKMWSPYHPPSPDAAYFILLGHSKDPPTCLLFSQLIEELYPGHFFAATVRNMRIALALAHFMGMPAMILMVLGFQQALRLDPFNTDQKSDQMTGLRLFSILDRIEGDLHSQSIPPLCRGTRCVVMQLHTTGTLYIHTCKKYKCCYPPLLYMNRSTQDSILSCSCDAVTKV